MDKKNDKKVEESAAAEKPAAETEPEPEKTEGETAADEARRIGEIGPQSFAIRDHVLGGMTALRGLCDELSPPWMDLGLEQTLTELAERLSLRHTPELVWTEDHSITYGARILDILATLDIPKDEEDNVGAAIGRPPEADASDEGQSK